MSWSPCYVVRGRALRYSPGQGNQVAGSGAVCGGGVREETMSLAQLSALFQSLLLLPTSKLGPSGADSWVGGFVYVLGSHGALQQTLL